ncbi:MAG: M20/M25/M40 family metallo-hydrolase [Chloroflexi bacterium]|nr:M20/M25/M40 family metallo-hydrolase [Chloroflexota bacterium]
MFELVKTLTEIFGPTGYEDAVQDWLARRWRELGLEVQTDKLGNLLAKLGGTGPKLLIGGHADEIAFRVQSVDESGYIWLTSGRGGVAERPPEPVPLGHAARIWTVKGFVEGTFVTITGHVMTQQQRTYYNTHALDWMDFYVDIGARSLAEVEEMGIHPGCPVINDVPTRKNGRNIVGKAMDNRAALAIMTGMAERVDRSKLQYEVWFTSTVMEEPGMIGARAVCRGFDLGIVVEVGLAGDIPLTDRRQMPIALGQGPILVHKDRAVSYTKEITFGLAKVAKEQGISVQHANFQNFTSDGKEWMLEGVPTAMICFPCRHTHSQHEIVEESDLEACADLLSAYATARR